MRKYGWFFAVAAVFVCLWAVPAFAALSIDGSASASSGASTPKTCTLTTTSANDIIIVVTTGNVLSTSVTGGSLSFTNEKQFTSGSDDTVVWYAVASGTLSSTALTINFSSATFNAAWCFGVSGANTSSPWDGNAALPVTFTSISSSTPGPSYSTTNANTMVIVAATTGGTGSPSAPTGFTLIGTNTSAFGLAAEEIVSGSQTGTNLSWSNTDSGVAGIVVALDQAGTVTVKSSSFLPLLGVGQ